MSATHCLIPSGSMAGGFRNSGSVSDPEAMMNGYRPWDVCFNERVMNAFRCPRATRTHEDASAGQPIEWKPGKPVG